MLCNERAIRALHSNTDLLATWLLVWIDPANALLASASSFDESLRHQGARIFARHCSCALFPQEYGVGTPCRHGRQTSGSRIELFKRSRRMRP